jgi:hypothetical protein
MCQKTLKEVEKAHGRGQKGPRKGSKRPKERVKKAHKKRSKGKAIINGITII